VPLPSELGRKTAPEEPEFPGLLCCWKFVHIERSQGKICSTSVPPCVQFATSINYTRSRKWEQEFLKSHKNAGWGGKDLKCSTSGPVKKPVAGTRRDFHAAALPSTWTPWLGFRPRVNSLASLVPRPP
jgi:hypothetical protein